MATGYTRQSASQIASGQPVASAPVNNEFNQLVSTFSTTGGHNHDGLTTGCGPQLGTSSFSGLNSTTAGLIIGSGTNTFGNVTITGTSNQITVVNGSGAAGNPTISIATGYVGQTSITTLGTIATGVWNGTIITGTYGGTGINNGANTITVGGNLTTASSFTTTGANPLTLATTGTTSVTLPTSGTLVNSAVTTLSSLTSIGTIGTGTWQGTAVAVGFGGTGTNLSATGGTSNVLLQATTGASITVRQLAASDLSNGNTGSGANVLANTPTLITPVLGAASGTSLTLSTPLNLASGGSNASLSASNGGIVYSTASALAVLAGTSTANQILMSGSSTTPAWSTATYPATTTVNRLLYSSSANVVAGLTTANSSVLVTDGSGVPSLSTTIPAVTLNSATVATTQTAADSSTKLATTAFVNGTALTLAAGTTAVTQAASDSSTKVATTAFVNSKFSPATSWTPVLNIGGSPTGITYSTQTGSYIQVGKLIIAELTLILSSKGVGTGNVTITGLPVSAANTFGMANMNYYASLSGTANSITGYVQGNIINPVFQTSSSQPVNLTDVNLANTSQLIMTCIFITT